MTEHLQQSRAGLQRREWSALLVALEHLREDTMLLHQQTLQGV